MNVVGRAPPVTPIRIAQFGVLIPRVQKRNDNVDIYENFRLSDVSEIELSSISLVLDGGCRE